MFPKKKFQGRLYDFEHLRPIKLDVQLGEEQVSIEIKFGCHCFTEAFDSLVHQDHHRYVHNGELRAFDERRYELSLQLPLLIENELLTGKIYKSQDSYTYLAHIPVQYKTGEKVVYPIFFAIEKDKNPSQKGVVVFVKSAYQKDDMRFAQNAMSWRFKALVAEFVGMGKRTQKSRPRKQKGPRRAPLGT